MKRIALRLRIGVCNVFFIAAVWAALLLGSIPAALAQSDGYVTNSNLRGLVPFASYQIDAIDSVNLGTGALNLNIPLFSHEGRGLNDARSVIYSSKLWTIVPVPHSLSPGQYVGFVWTPTLHFGPRVTGTRAMVDYIEQFYDCVPGDGGAPYPMQVRSNFTVTAADGGLYRFANRDLLASPWDQNRICTSLNTAKYVKTYSDRGAMALETNSTNTDSYTYSVRYRDGVKDDALVWPAPSGGSRKTDRNGNFLNATDTLARSYPATVDSGTIEMSVKDSAGTNWIYRLIRTVKTVTPQFPTTNCGANFTITQPPRNLSQITRIELPNGLAYQLSYDDNFGELTRIDLPTGGWIRYVYATIPTFDIVPAPPFLPCVGLDSRRVAERRVSSDGVTEKVWTYSYQLNGSGQYVTTVTDPEGNRSIHTFDNQGIHELETEYRTGATTPLKRVVNAWQFNWAPVQTDQQGNVEFDAKGKRIISATTTLLDANRVTRTETVYDSFSWSLAGSHTDSRMNVVERKEYDFGSGAAGPLLRRTTYSYLHESNNNYLNRHIWDRVTLQQVYNGSGALQAQTAFSYDTTAITSVTGVTHHASAAYPASMPYRGNVTEERRWLNANGSWLTTTHWYDILGNRIQTRDPGLHTTVFSYADSWANTACASGVTTRAFMTQATDAAGHVTKTKYFPCTSLAQSATDANNRTTSFTYDRMDRSKTVGFPDGGLIQVFYSDVDGGFSVPGAIPLRTRVVTRISSSPLLEKVELTVFDRLGREQMRGTSNNSQRDWVRTEYDGKGRLHRVSNPRSLGSSTEIPTAGNFSKWTTTEFDGLDRVVKITTQDGQTVTTLYEGDWTTTTDQRGARRKNRSDGLGRIVVVHEPNPQTNSLTSGHYVTTYGYNALDDLTTVSQGGQTRSFVYDSLSRLTSESHPESGTVSYVYNVDSLPTLKTDARGVAVNMAYDALHRLTSKGYSDGTPSVSYSYDSASSTNGKGRLTGLSDSTGSAVFHYDSMGRITTKTRTTQGVVLNQHYAYNLAGGVAQLHLPELATTQNYAFDNAGRQKSLIFGAGFLTVVGNYTFTYASNGTATETLTYGNFTTETIQYIERLQPTGRTVLNGSLTRLNLSFGFGEPGTGKNNGNLWTITDHLNSGFSQSFGYDWLNRIENFWSGGMGSLTYTLDRWGNRQKQCGSGGAPTMNLTISASTNRITARRTNNCTDAPNLSVGHDAAGNMTSEPGRTYQYDAENRIKSVNNGSVAVYQYDADGRRSVKNSASGTRIYFYDVEGRPVAESGPTQGGWLSGHAWFQDRHAFENTGSQFLWRHPDHLGTAVVRTDSNGGKVCDSRFYPYGEEFTASCAGDPYKFTGKERDSETGLDYFGARYYGNHYGRFTSVDPADDSDAGDPQRWNKYAYARNDPLKYVDPDGQKILRRTELAVTPDMLKEHVDQSSLPGSVKSLLNLAIDFLVPDIGSGDVTALVGIPVSGIVRAGKGAAKTLTEATGNGPTFQRVMSNAELRATQETGLLRGGRPGENFFTNSASLDAKRAHQRLGLDGPLRDVRVEFTIKNRVQITGPRTAKKGQSGSPGGGREFSTKELTEIEIIRVDSLRK